MRSLAEPSTGTVGNGRPSQRAEAPLSSTSASPERSRSKLPVCTASWARNGTLAVTGATAADARTPAADAPPTRSPEVVAVAHGPLGGLDTAEPTASASARVFSSVAG